MKFFFKNLSCRVEINKKSENVFFLLLEGLKKELQQIYVWSKEMFGSCYNNLKIDPKQENVDSWKTLVAACETIAWSVVDDSGIFLL